MASLRSPSSELRPDQSSVNWLLLQKAGHLYTPNPVDILKSLASSAAAPIKRHFLPLSKAALHADSFADFPADHDLGDLAAQRPWCWLERGIRCGSGAAQRRGTPERYCVGMADHLECHRNVRGVDHHQSVAG